MPKDDLYKRVTGHEIKIIVEKEVDALRKSIEGISKDSTQYEKTMPQIRDHENFLHYLEKNDLNTTYTIRDYTKWPNPAEKTEAMLLRLEPQVIDSLLEVVEKREKLPKINPDFPLQKTQLMIHERFITREMNSHANAILSFYTNKLPAPIMYGDKLCSSQGYINHFAIMNNFHQANDQAIFYDEWMKVTRPEELTTINSLKQQKAEAIAAKIDEFIKYIKENKNCLALKELKPKIKELNHAMKDITNTQSQSR